MAAVRMTGYQGRAVGRAARTRSTSAATAHLIAFTVRLAKPTAEEVNVLQRQLRHAVQARLSVLRRGTTRKTRLDHRLINQSDTFELDRYFGSSPTFVFDKPIPVKKGNWIALTVPTWAPLLVDEPGAHELVALVAAEGQLRAAQEPAPVRDGGSARGRTSSAAPTTARGCSTRSPTCRATTSRTRRAEASKRPSTGRAIAVASTR